MTAPSWVALDGPRHELAEEPTLDGRRVLYVDVARGEIWHRSRPFTGRPQLLHELPPPVSAARPYHRGIVVASRMNVLHFGRDGFRSIIAELPYDPGRWQVNGLVVLPDDTLLLGLLSRDRSEAGELVRVVDGGATPVVTGVLAANGLCVDPDGTAVWHIDTYARTLTRYAASRLAEAAVVARVDGLPGRPDGICPALAGGVWVAMWDGGLLARIGPEGAVRDTIEVPVARPTCPLQIGSRLIVTTAASPRSDPLDGAVLATAPGFLS